MKKKETVKFVECRVAPGLQPYGHGSFIYKKCKCGEVVSYDTANQDHFTKYEIKVSLVRVKDFDKWYRGIEEEVASNKEKYRVEEWSE